jgi:ribosome biogenesis protein Tsr3
MFTVKLQKLLNLLISADNQAADDLLLEALALGNEYERKIALEAITRRANGYGLMGVLHQFADLPPSVQKMVIDKSAVFYFVLSEAGRGDDRAARLAAIQVISEARIGKLSYVLSENLRDPDDQLSKSACDALLEMSRWVNMQSRLMHRFVQAATEEDGLTLVGEEKKAGDSTIVAAPTIASDLATAYATVMRERPEIESAVARALDWGKSKHVPDLLRAALLLCDHPQSKTLAILKTTRHGGQASMVRKLQQPPGADHVEAFLLGASHGHLRTNFAAAFAQISDANVLDVLLKRSHWLRDHQLNTCMHHVDRGVWWGENDLPRDLQNRSPRDAMRIADYLVASGLHDTLQDARLAQLVDHAKSDPLARLHILRCASQRARMTCADLYRKMLDDPDERLVRIAVREIIRRKPADYENLLLQRMTRASESVRRVISRAIGQAGFDGFWNRYDRMDRATRKQAGRAMLKLLSDAPVRIGRQLTAGTIDNRVRAMQIVQDLDLASQFGDQLKTLCEHPNARVRSKAVGLLIEVPNEATANILERVLSDSDGRVRANAIEVLEAKRSTEYVPMLTERARSSHNRERANAIKALHRMKVGVASEQLGIMLNDPRSEHRISALWTLRHIGLWMLIGEVGRLAKTDESLKVRRYAAAILKSIVEQLQQSGSIPASQPSPRAA